MSRKRIMGKRSLATAEATRANDSDPGMIGFSAVRMILLLAYVDPGSAGFIITTVLGVLAAVEFQPGVAAPAGQLGAKVIRACRQRGLFTRFCEDIVMLAPPLVIRESELDEVTTTLREAVTEVAG